MDEALALARRIAANDPLAVQAHQAGDQSQPRHRRHARRRLLQALEIDVQIETSETAESREFNAILRRDGAKAAIAWRSARAVRNAGESS